MKLLLIMAGIIVATWVVGAALNGWSREQWRQWWDSRPPFPQLCDKHEERQG
jgi:hypothetical protein